MRYGRPGHVAGAGLALWQQGPGADAQNAQVFGPVAKGGRGLAVQGRVAGAYARARPQVDLSKVNMEVINGWIEQRVTELLGFEDDVLIDMVSNLLAMKVRPWAPGARPEHRRATDRPDARSRPRACPRAGRRPRGDAASAHRVPGQAGGPVHGGAVEPAPVRAEAAVGHSAGAHRSQEARNRGRQAGSQRSGLCAAAPRRAGARPGCRWQRRA